MQDTLEHEKKCKVILYYYLLKLKFKKKKNIQNFAQSDNVIELHCRPRFVDDRIVKTESTSSAPCHARFPIRALLSAFCCPRFTVRALPSALHRTTNVRVLPTVLRRQS